MPLDRYGALVGVLTGHHRDRPDDQGRWYHVHLAVQAPAGRYDCAIDVDSHESAVGVMWKVVRVPAVALGPVASSADGYHELGHLQSEGAIDLIRHPALVDDPGYGEDRPWTSGSHVQATEALESILEPGSRTIVWGEPFTIGRGMHNVHQNQGDPVDSQWSGENGIWQDGATMTLRADGDYDAFVSKFSSQAASTDADGHPV